MNKKLYVLLVAISFLFIPQGYVFFDGDLGVDIYKSIDDGLTKSEAKTYQYELTAQGDKKIYEELNRILKSNGLKECLLSGISINDLSKIQNGDLDTMTRSLNPDCLAGDGSAPLELTNLYMTNIKKVLSRIKKESEEKTKKIYEIARIGLYSDGDKTNSPFDLVDDIREIEKIIFTQKIDYNGVISNVDKDFDNLLNGVLRDPKHTGTGNTDNTGSGATGSGSIGTWVTTTKYTPFITLTQTGSYVCSDSLTNVYTSGLSEETIKKLLYSTGGTTHTGTTHTGTGGTGVKSNTGSYEKFSPSLYEKINDNSLWPCDGFFCIKIEFVMKHNNLLTGGKTVSIESILKKSNEHLKKFANTFMGASEMTNNNFQPPWLGGMNLSSMFHMGVSIQSRTPPILNIDKTIGSSSDKSEYTCKNMFEEIYKNKGLEYQSANNIQIYEGDEEDQKTLADTAELPFVESAVKARTLQMRKEIMERKNDFLSKAIDKKAMFEDADIYVKEFVELEMFGQALRDYIEKLNGLVKKLDDIPISQ